MTVTQLTYDVTTLTAPAAVTTSGALHSYSAPPIKVISNPSGGASPRGSDGLVWPTGVQRFGKSAS